jgi:F-type H+-transporting ATPase subunit c
MKALQRAYLVVMVLLAAASMASAADQAAPKDETGPAVATNPFPGLNVSALSGAAFGAGIGAGIAIIGAGWGFGRIGAAALESMARQPEISARIQTAMIVIAALLEGVAFFALVVCIYVATKITVSY